MKYIPTAILFALTLCLVPGVRAEGDSLIKNGGFEEWRPLEEVWPTGGSKPYGCAKRAPKLEDNLAPKAWWVMEYYVGDEAPAEQCTLVRDDLIKYEGQFSVRVESPSPVFTVGVGVHPFPIERGEKTYCIRGYVRGENIELQRHKKEEPHLALTINFGAGSTFWTEKTVKVFSLTTQRGSFDWTPFEFRVQSPATADTMMLRMALCTASGKAWFDALEVKAVEN